VDGHVRVKGNPAKSLTWVAACKKLGATKISEEGENQQRSPGGLNSSGVGGVQIADVSVDTETGIVKMNKFVAVQDIGLVINPELAKSQIYGAVIMGICSALMEERVMDEQTGRILNPDMEFYKLAGIGDIGEIVVHLDITERMTNAAWLAWVNRPLSARRRPSAMRWRMPSGCGCRVFRSVPIGCWRRWKGGTRNMQAFAYSNPTTVQEAVGLLGARWGDVDVLAGGTDLISLMKEYPHAQARGEYQERQGAWRHQQICGRRAHRRHSDAGGTGNNADIKQIPVAAAGGEGVRARRSANMGTVGGDLASARAAGITGRASVAGR
jgi:hypothetical protein